MILILTRGGKVLDNITIIILTFNEELNIEKCLTEAVKLTKKIVIVDSYSNDKTLDICAKYDCRLYQHKFTNQALQLNWALENVEIDTEWVFRLDADEYLTDKLLEEFLKKIEHLSNNITGIYLRRRIYFMGKWIKHGGIYPTLILRVWRNKKAICEERWMDEHMMILEGETITFNYDFVDDNSKDMSFWINKHNNYASREAFEQLNDKYELNELNVVAPKLFGSQEERKKYIKKNIYNRVPAPFRSLFYFLYRYILKLGFLDGFKGWVYHFMESFWYRFLVDIKSYEIEREARRNKISVRSVIKSKRLNKV